MTQISVGLVPVATVALVPSSAAMYVGQTVQLSATPKDSAGNTLAGRQINWTSSDSSVAGVSVTGLVSAKAEGTVTITANSGGKSATAEVAISKVPVRSVRISQFSPELFVSDTATVTAVAYDSAGHPLADRSVAWRSTDAAVATVSSDGLVTGLATGKFFAVASVGDVSDSVLVRTGVVESSPIAAAYLTTCALTDERRAYCWGENRNGSLGNGSAGFIQTVTTPGPVQNSPAFAMIAGTTNTPANGAAFCGLNSVGEIFCWGASFNYNTGADAPLPSATRINGMRRFSSVQVGSSHSCGLTLGQSLYCWGWNGYGAFGDGTAGSTWATPQLAFGGVSVRSFTVGNLFTCVITTDGRTLCAGLDQYQQLGTTVGASICNGYACILTPTSPSGALEFAAVTAGDEFTCGLTSAGYAYCWGHDTNGRLGIGPDVTPDLVHGTPTPVAGGLTFSEVVAGQGGACAITTGGDAYCWGATYSSTSVPTPVSGASAVVSLSRGGEQVCATNLQGILWCWGGNTYGELGDGTTKSRDNALPVALPGHTWAPR